MAGTISKLFSAIAIVFTLLPTNAWPQEALQSFEVQNGLLSKKQFDEAQAAFEEIETPAKGLGIHFNETSCAGCHGRATARSTTRSTVAYMAVLVRLRWRNTWPISGRAAPRRSNSLARA